ncbi:MAG: NUDIX domain-containing protein [Chitinophagaceae bacterium]|jgi:8-oxo-dGTP pyrophosphatase MutT (NUDIX family)
MKKKTIVAAGGLVFNENKELLMIFRRAKWDLPKGKLDEGETIEECAIREVEEETGVQQIILGKLIQKTYHEYFDQWIHEDVIKETWWFEMFVSKKQQLLPQTEEDIERIIWADATTIETCLENSYSTIIEVINNYFND